MFDFLQHLILFDQHLFELIYRGLRPESMYWRDKVDHFFIVGNVLGEFWICLPVLVWLYLNAVNKRQFATRVAVIVLGIAFATIAANVTKSVANRTRPVHVFSYERSSSLPQWRYEQPKKYREMGNMQWGAPLPWLHEFINVPVDLHDVYRPLYTTRSFPSGHAQFAFSLATALGAWFWRLKVPLFIWAWLTALSRIYGGHHFPIDVILGAFYGWAGVHIALSIMRGILTAHQKRRPDATSRWLRWLELGLPPLTPHEARVKHGSRVLGGWLAAFAFILAMVAALQIAQAVPNLPNVPMALIPVIFAVGAYWLARVPGTNVVEVFAKRYPDPKLDVGAYAGTTFPTDFLPITPDTKRLPVPEEKPAKANRKNRRRRKNRR